MCVAVLNAERHKLSLMLSNMSRMSARAAALGRVSPAPAGAVFSSDVSNITNDGDIQSHSIQMSCLDTTYTSSIASKLLAVLKCLHTSFCPLLLLKLNINLQLLNVVFNMMLDYPMYTFRDVRGGC